MRNVLHGDSNRVLSTAAASSDEDSDDEFIPRAPLKNPTAVSGASTLPKADKTKAGKKNGGDTCTSNKQGVADDKQGDGEGQRGEDDGKQGKKEVESDK